MRTDWKVFWSALPLHRKMGFCYLFHLRWILLLAAVLAAVINPLLMSPLVYPINTWSIKVQVCVYSAVFFYCFIALIGVIKSMQHDRARPLAIVSLGAFFLLGWVYVVLHFILHTIAFIKVFTGTQGGWEVTTRSIKGTSPVKGWNADGGRGRVGPPALSEPLLLQADAEAAPGGAR